jgi:WD40 repeat protein
MRRAVNVYLLLEQAASSSFVEKSSSKLFELQLEFSWETMMKLLTRLFLLALIVSACTPALQSDVVTTPEERQDFGYFLRWSPDDKLLSVTANSGLYVYDTDTLEQVAAFPGLGGSTVAFSNEYMSAINHGGLYAWDRKDFHPLFHEKAADPIQFQSLAISPDGKWLVSGEQKQFRVWELPSGNVLATLPIDGFASNLTFTGHNTLIVIEQYKALVEEWDLQTMKRIHSFEVPRDVLFFTLGEDGKVMLVDYGESGVELWNVETGEPDHYYRQMQGASGWTRLSGDNRLGIVWGYAVDGDNSGMGVWDLEKDVRLYEFSTPFVNGDGWRSGALNLDGTVLAASNTEGYIYFYDLNDGNKIGEIYLSYKFVI